MVTMSTKTHIHPLTIVAVSALALSLASCGSSSTSAGQDGTSGAATSAAAATSGAPAAGDDDVDVTASALTAILAAESADGGTAYSIDDQDSDGTWEIDALVEGASVEYEVSADGTVVRLDDSATAESDDTDDADDTAESDDTGEQAMAKRTALEGAAVSLTDAISTAVVEGGAPLDDAELDDESGTWAWEVSLEGRDKDVVVDLSTGGIVGS